jgi:hypothetical protein
MVDLHGRARDAASMAPAHGAPVQDLPSAGRGRPSVPQQVLDLDRAAGHREPTLGLPAHPRGAAAPWLPGFRKLHCQGPARERSPAGAATGFHHVAVVVTWAFGRVPARMARRIAGRGGLGGVLGGPQVDLPAQPAGPSVHGGAGPRLGASARRGESDLGLPEGHGELVGLGQRVGKYRVAEYTALWLIAELTRVEKGGDHDGTVKRKGLLHQLQHLRRVVSYQDPARAGKQLEKGTHPIRLLWELRSAGLLTASPGAP